MVGWEVILAPLNSMVNSINNRMVQTFVGEMMIYSSVDSAITEDEAVHFPVEFLNSLEMSGLPPHNLCLEVGIPIIVLRSLDPPMLPMVHAALLPDSSQMLSRLKSCMAYLWGKRFYSLGYLSFHQTHHCLLVSKECNFSFSHALQ